MRRARPFHTGRRLKDLTFDGLENTSRDLPVGSVRAENY